MQSGSGFAVIERIRDHVGQLPYMRFRDAEQLRSHLSQTGARNCLELGTYHGVGTAYMAEILRENGGGHVTSIDRRESLKLSPDAATLLDRLGLLDMVTLHLEARCYTWRLMHLIEASDGPIFDFCYIDGGHNWKDSGLAFFLVDRLLRPGGWLLFDDLDWSYERMIAANGTRPAFMSEWPEDEIRTPQVRKVWDLLVSRHPGYDNLREDGKWGFARKRP